jgi:hypothetical protein
MLIGFRLGGSRNAHQHQLNEPATRTMSTSEKQRVERIRKIHPTLVAVLSQYDAA